MIVYAEPSLYSIAIGFIVLIFGELVRLWGVSIAGSETRVTDSVSSSQLITTGPFAYIRNPLYFGNMCIYTGIAIMSWAGYPLLPIITLSYFIFQYSLIVSLEEEYLIKKYGIEYQKYQKEVPKFFPNLKRYKSQNIEQPILDWRRGLKSEKRTFQAIGIVIAIILSIWILRVHYGVL